MKHYITAFILITSQAFGEYREFHNADGNSIQAKIVSVQDGLVTIERQDKQVFTIPLARFSDEDIAYIQANHSENLETNSPKTASTPNPTDLKKVRAQLASKYPVDSKMTRNEASDTYDQGKDQLKQGNFEKALSLWASIPKKRKEYVKARRRAGFNILGRELDRWEEALVFLLDAYAVDPKNEKVLEDLGRAYMRLDDFENAKQYLSKAETLNAKKALQTIEAMQAAE